MDETTVSNEERVDDTAIVDSNDAQRRLSQRISRRRLLVAGGAAMAGAATIGGLAVLGAESGMRLPFEAAATPTATPQRLVRRYRSRPDLPTPRVSIASPAFRAAPGLVFLTPGNGPGPMIVDDTGEAVWVRAAANGVRAVDLRPATYRGDPVLAWWEGTVTNFGVGVGEHIIVDASYAEVARVRGGNGVQSDLHDFLLTPDGTALITAYRRRPSPESDARGFSGMWDSLVQEIDVATGTVLFEWRSADHVAVSESYDPGHAGQPYDYFHINSIDVDPDGNLLISARHTWAIYKVDRGSGDVIWRLGGKRSDFTMGPGTGYAWQHDARWQPDGSMTVFDNGSNGASNAEGNSRGLVLKVDESARVATLVRAYAHPRKILATSQGDMQVLPNGNVFIGWGSEPFFSEFAATGGLQFDAHFSPDAYSYRARRFEWTGQPGEPPAVVLERGGDSAVAYVSWNGATEVASWVAVAGDTSDSLSAVASSPRRGFETAIVIPGQPAVVAVRGLDASGNVLAQSPARSA